MAKQAAAAGREDERSREMRTACSYLFPAELLKDKDFFRNIDIETVKKAYRKKAKAYHPDMHPQASKGAASDHFMKIQSAYELITSFLLEKMEPAAEKIARKRAIIAVGGAKGGVGKSVFAANLGVFLASRGFKTVVVDLDLGGANIHLYLGKRKLLKRTINDFLGRRVNTLEEIMVESDYGPLLIGGNSSELGAANIEFAKKLRLIKSIGNIDADYVVLDLGGDTSYNIIDFFLQADHGIVVTTRDSASYISAYHFIKAALYRKLNRLFGPESNFRDQKDADLERFIREATTSPEGAKARTVGDLIENIRQHRPLDLSVVTKAIADFRPYLIVNKVTKDADAHRVVMKVQDVTKKWLSKEVAFLGNIAVHKEIEESVIDLVPVVAKHPHGRFAAEIEDIVKKLLHRG